MHDDPSIDSRGVVAGHEADHALSLPREREGGVADQLFAKAEELFLEVRARLASLLDRTDRWRHPDPGTGMLRVDRTELELDLERLYAELGHCGDVYELALERCRPAPMALDAAPGDTPGLGDLEQLGEFSRRISASETLLAERLRPLLHATWRPSEDPWRQLGARHELWRARDAARLESLGVAFRELVQRSLGIDPTSSGIWATAMAVSDPFGEILLQLERAPVALRDLAIWIGRTLPDLRGVQARVLFAALLPRLLETVALAEAREEVETVERVVTAFARCDFFERRRHSDGVVALLEALDAQLVRLAGRRSGLADAVGASRGQVDDRAFEAALGTLPALVQQSLARQGRFLEVFAVHADYQVAREVTQYLHVGNLERVLALRELNRRVLEDLLRFVALGPDKLTLALSHPSCPLVFAGRHLARLNPAQLHRVIQEPGTQPEIRRKAMLLTIRRRSGQNVLSEAAIPAAQAAQPHR